MPQEPPARSGPASPVSVQTGVVTLLFTDLVSSTALKQHLGDKAGAALMQQQRALVRQLLTTCPGAEEIETAGDSFLLSFAKPSDAVRFALVLQSRLRGLNEGQTTPLEERIGIHLGEVVVEQHQAGHKPKDLYGLQIDTCARVMSLAKGGQVLLSRGVFDSARQVLKGEDIEGIGPLEWLNHGPYSLKGLEEPVEVCEVREAGQEMAPGPPTSSEKAQRQVRADEEPVLGWRPAVGQVVPNTRWVLEKKLGEGGFGEVWLGRHQTMKEQRVFKFCFRADRVRSLKREMTLFRLIKERIGDHPHIVSLREVCFDEPPYYVVMDHVDGSDLKHWGETQGGLEPVPLETKLEVVAQVADALQAAHDAGVIHRDVKPANILISGQKSEIGGQKSEIGGQKSEIGGQKSEIGGQKSEVGGQKSEVGGQKSEVGGQKSEIGGQKSEVGNQKPAADSRQAVFSGQGYDASKPGADLRPPISDLRFPVAKLTDFGIGQVVSQEYLAGVTKMGFTQTLLGSDSSSQTGTQLYLAPELLAGKPATTRSDLYSLGVVLYQLLVGDFTRPLTTDWAREILDPLLQEDLQLCFAGKPEERFAGAAQVARHLRSLPQRRAEWARREAEQAALARAAYRRGMMRASAMALGVIALIASLAAYSWHATRLADAAAARAERNAQSETRQREAAERNVYAMSMILAFQALENSHLGRARELMRGQIPQPGHKDWRGWEWRYLWQQCQGDELFTLGTHPDMAPSVAFFPDGRTVVSGGGPAVKLWDVPSRRLLESFVYSNRVMNVAVSPDGSLVASGCERGLVKLWNRATHAVLLERTTGRDICALSFSRDGRTLAWADAARLVLWDVAAGRESDAYSGWFSWWKAGIAFSPDNRWLAFARTNAVEIWDRQGRFRQAVFPNLGVALGLAFSPDSKVLVAGLDPHALYLLDVEHQTKRATTNSFSEWVGGVAFSPDGTMLAAASADQRVHLFETRSWTETATLRGHEFEIWSVAFAPDGRRLVTGSKDGTIKVWDPLFRRERALRSKTPPDEAGGSISSDGLVGVRYDTNGTFALMDVPALREEERRPLPTDLHVSYALVSSGRKYLAFGSTDGSVRLYEPGTMRERFRSATNPLPVAALVFSPDGHALAIKRENRTLKKQSLEVLETTHGQSIHSRNSSNEWIGFLDFSPDGRTLAMTTQDPTVELLDLRTGKGVFLQTGHKMAVQGLAFSHDGAKLATCTWDVYLKLWDPKTLRQVGQLGGQLIAFNSVAFSQDDQRLAGAGNDGSLTMWDMTGLQPLEVAKIQVSKKGIGWLQFSKDNETLKAWADQTLFIFRAPPLNEIDARSSIGTGRGTRGEEGVSLRLHDL